MSEPSLGAPRVESPFIDSKDLDKGLPEIPYLFDSVGAIITDRNSISEIVATPDEQVPPAVKEFVLAHSTHYPDNTSLISLRNSEYFALTTQMDTHDRKIDVKTVFEELNTITDLCTQMQEIVTVDQETTAEQKLALLCLLDYGKGISLKILDNEFTAARTKVGPDYQPALELAQNYVDAYYTFLLQGSTVEILHLKSNLAAVDAAQLHNPNDKNRTGYADWVREMDNPLLIVFQINRICNELQNGVPCDVILTPFQGASEIGLALKSRIKMLGNLPVPEVIPIKYGGKQARAGTAPDKLFAHGFNPDRQIRGKHVWIVDDNIVTGNTQVRLSQHIESQYAPAEMRASVVQVSDGEIKEDLEPQLKKLLATRAVSATFAAYAVPEDDIELYRFSLPLEPHQFALQERELGR